MATINVGVVGLGFMGSMHIKAYLKIPGVHVAAICDAVRLPIDGDLSDIQGNIGTAEPLKLDMTQVKATYDMQDLLDDPSIDIIDLCVPTAAHPKLAVAALEAGKHVVCEKPLARTSALADTIVRAAASAKGYFLPAMCIRFWPEYAWLKEHIDAETYGRVIGARFHRLCEPPGWSDDFLDGEKTGGALHDLHIHDADFVQYCFGRPKSVFASGFTRLSGAVDYVLAQYEVESGIPVSAEGSWAMHPGYGFSMGFTVVFERATVDFDSARGAEAFRLFEQGKPTRIVEMKGGDGYYWELAHMVECVREGRPPSIVTAEDARSAVEICEAEERSVATGKVVAL